MNILEDVFDDFNTINEFNVNVTVIFTRKI